MITKTYLKRKSTFFKLTAWIILVAFGGTGALIPHPSYAQNILPSTGLFLSSSPAYVPAFIKALVVHPENPFQFDFIVDTGHSKLDGDALKDETKKLVRYFLVTVTVPDQDQWVNLSPYEADRIIPTEFAKTEMGQDLLAQDFILKQLTASLMHPEGEVGEKFWKKIRARAKKEFARHLAKQDGEVSTNLLDKFGGEFDMQINTFNKVWIVPDTASVYEEGNVAIVTEARLKVMLEKDYLATQEDGREKMEDGKTEHASILDSHPSSIIAPPSSNTINQIIRDIIIPELEREVNEGEHFAPLRQIYYSMILASWYKDKVKGSILNDHYANQNKVKGIDLSAPDAKDKIYAQYTQAFKKGAYDFIKEDYDPATQEVTAHRYFAGGIEGDVETTRDRDLTPSDTSVTGEFVSAQINMIQQDQAVADSIESLYGIREKELTPVTQEEVAVEQLYEGVISVVPGFVNFNDIQGGDETQFEQLIFDQILAKLRNQNDSELNTLADTLEKKQRIEGTEGRWRNDNFQSVLRELRKNALRGIRLSDNSDGKIIFTIERMGNEIVISVQDNGIGLSDVDESRLGESGYTSKAGEAKETDGRGIAHIKAYLNQVLGNGAKFDIRSNSDSDGVTVEIRVTIAKNATGQMGNEVRDAQVTVIPSGYQIKGRLSDPLAVVSGEEVEFNLTVTERGKLADGESLVELVEDGQQQDESAAIIRRLMEVAKNLNVGRAYYKELMHGVFGIPVRESVQLTVDSLQQKQGGEILIFEGLRGEAIAELHEVGEYLGDKQLQFEFEGEELLIEIRAGPLRLDSDEDSESRSGQDGSTLHSIKLTRTDALGFAQRAEQYRKNGDLINAHHYFIRALQRQMFGERDVQLSRKIEVLQNPPVARPEVSGRFLPELITVVDVVDMFKREYDAGRLKEWGIDIDSYRKYGHVAVYHLIRDVKKAFGFAKEISPATFTQRVNKLLNKEDQIFKAGRLTVERYFVLEELIGELYQKNTLVQYGEISQLYSFVKLFQERLRSKGLSDKKINLTHLTGLINSEIKLAGILGLKSDDARLSGWKMPYVDMTWDQFEAIVGYFSGLDVFEMAQKYGAEDGSGLVVLLKEIKEGKDKDLKKLQGINLSQLTGLINSKVKMAGILGLKSDDVSLSGWKMPKVDMTWDQFEGITDYFSGLDVFEMVQKYGVKDGSGLVVLLKEIKEGKDENLKKLQGINLNQLTGLINSKVKMAGILGLKSDDVSLSGWNVSYVNMTWDEAMIHYRIVPVGQMGNEIRDVQVAAIRSGYQIKGRLSDPLAVVSGEEVEFNLTVTERGKLADGESLVELVEDEEQQDESATIIRRLMEVAKNLNVGRAYYKELMHGVFGIPVRESVQLTVDSLQQKQGGEVMLFEGLRGEGIAELHEVGEYLGRENFEINLIDGDRLAIRIRAGPGEGWQDLPSIQLTYGNSLYYAKRAQGFLQEGDPTKAHHYFLRALQRQIFQKADEALSNKISVFKDISGMKVFNGERAQFIFTDQERFLKMYGDVSEEDQESVESFLSVLPELAHHKNALDKKYAVNAELFNDCSTYCEQSESIISQAGIEVNQVTRRTQNRPEYANTYYHTFFEVKVGNKWFIVDLTAGQFVYAAEDFTGWPKNFPNLGVVVLPKEYVEANADTFWMYTTGEESGAQRQAESGQGTALPLKGAAKNIHQEKLRRISSAILSRARQSLTRKDLITNILSRISDLLFEEDLNEEELREVGNQVRAEWDTDQWGHFNQYITLAFSSDLLQEFPSAQRAVERMWKLGGGNRADQFITAWSLSIDMLRHMRIQPMHDFFETSRGRRPFDLEIFVMAVRRYLAVLLSMSKDERNEIIPTLDSDKASVPLTHKQISLWLTKAFLDYRIMDSTKLENGGGIWSEGKGQSIQEYLRRILNEPIARLDEKGDEIFKEGQQVFVSSQELDEHLSEALVLNDGIFAEWRLRSPWHISMTSVTWSNAQFKDGKTEEILMAPFRDGNLRLIQAFDPNGSVVRQEKSALGFNQAHLYITGANYDKDQLRWVQEVRPNVGGGDTAVASDQQNDVPEFEEIREFTVEGSFSLSNRNILIGRIKSAAESNGLIFEDIDEANLGYAIDHILHNLSQHEYGDPENQYLVFRVYESADPLQGLRIEFWGPAEGEPADFREELKPRENLKIKGWFSASDRPWEGRAPVDLRYSASRNRISVTGMFDALADAKPRGVEILMRWGYGNNHKGQKGHVIAMHIPLERVPVEAGDGGQSSESQANAGAQSPSEFIERTDVPAEKLKYTDNEDVAKDIIELLKQQIEDPEHFLMKKDGLRNFRLALRYLLENLYQHEYKTGDYLSFRIYYSSSPIEGLRLEFLGKSKDSLPEKYFENGKWFNPSDPPWYFQAPNDARTDNGIHGTGVVNMFDWLRRAIPFGEPVHVSWRDAAEGEGLHAGGHVIAMHIPLDKKISPTQMQPQPVQQQANAGRRNAGDSGKGTAVSGQQANAGAENRRTQLEKVTSSSSLLPPKRIIDTPARQKALEKAQEFALDDVLPDEELQLEVIGRFTTAVAKQGSEESDMTSRRKGDFITEKFGFNTKALMKDLVNNSYWLHVHNNSSGLGYFCQIKSVDERGFVFDLVVSDSISMDDSSFDVRLGMKDPEKFIEQLTRLINEEASPRDLASIQEHIKDGLDTDEIIGIFYDGNGNPLVYDAFKREVLEQSDSQGRFTPAKAIYDKKLPIPYQVKPVEVSGQGQAGSDQGSSNEQRATSNENQASDLGGIDFTRKGLDLDVTSSSSIKFQYDPKAFENIQIDGLVPVIINMTPIPSLYPLLGRTDPNEDDSLPEEIVYNKNN